jgi:hypothetical protein
MNPADIPAWLQAGGLLAFAAAVWMEQRAMRAAMQKQGDHIAAILEHVRATAAAPKPRAASNPVIGE